MGPTTPKLPSCQPISAVRFGCTKQYDEAEGLFADAIRIQVSRFGPDYAQLVPLYEEYAAILHANQHFAASESAKVQAMRIRVRQALGKASVAG